MLFVLSPAKTLDYETPLPDTVAEVADRVGPRPGAFTPRHGAAVARDLDRLLRDHDERVVVNLASQEYFRVVQARDARGRPALKARVVDCVFEDWKDGDWKIISFFAKVARSRMARHAIERRA